MKRPAFYFILAILPFALSCNQNNKDSNHTNGSTAVKTDPVIKNECLTALDDRDTANLKIETKGSGKITGHLLIKYLEKGKNEGEIEGKFKGDTLFVDYTFKIGTDNPTVYKNPLALLREDGKLILGVGQIETSLGKSYFVRGKPISFDKGRFTFAPVDCK